MIYPKLTFCWNKPNKLLPTMAAITKTKATIAKRALTSYMLYGALNKGFLSTMIFRSLNVNNHIILMLEIGIERFY